VARTNITHRVLVACKVSNWATNVAKRKGILSTNGETYTAGLKCLVRRTYVIIIIIIILVYFRQRMSIAQ